MICLNELFSGSAHQLLLARTCITCIRRPKQHDGFTGPVCYFLDNRACFKYSRHQSLAGSGDARLQKLIAHFDVTRHTSLKVVPKVVKHVRFKNFSFHKFYRRQSSFTPGYPKDLFLAVYICSFSILINSQLQFARCHVTTVNLKPQ